MFTGLIQAVGTILKRTVSGNDGKITVKSSLKFDDLVYGESIAVNGVCLTLEHFDGEILQFHTLEETLKRSNLGSLPLGAEVNLERALRLSDRLGGHLVSGHVDGVGRFLGMAKNGSDVELKIEYPSELGAFIVDKGSIAIDGVSLTLVKITDSFFTVHLIPATLGATALASRKIGELINLETDMIGKYVFRQLKFLRREESGPSVPSGTVTMEKLINAGFLD